MTEQSPAPSTGFSRRSVVRTAAWSVPAISLASAAPAFAASPECVEAPVTATPRAWAVTAGTLARWDANTTGWLPTGGGPGHAENNWIGGAPNSGFVSASDPGIANQDTTVVVEYDFASFNGATFTFFTDLIVQYGNGGDGAERQDLTIEVVQNGIVTDELLKITTAERHGQTNSPRSDQDMADMGFDVLEAGRYNGLGGTFEGTVTGTSQIRLTFHLWAVPEVWGDGDNQQYAPNEGRWVNNDLWVGEPVMELTACPV